MDPNPLKWPSFEQLGREMYESLVPALEQLETGAKDLDDEAKRGVARIQSWLDAPCVATIKLDGTNVGVDDAGLVVGRNTVIAPGEKYQKTDVFALLDGYPDKVARIRDELVGATGEAVQQTMLYGELVVNSKYDYTAAGIFKQWLCFGMALRVTDDEAALRLANKLRAIGYNAKACSGCVRITQNMKLAALLQSLNIVTVADTYRPLGNITEAQWAEHDGAGNLAFFQSLRQFILSQWAQRFLLPSDGVPLGEGFVVSSEADGKLFKWKHAGEDLGKVPEQLAKAVEALGGFAGSHQIECLPSGLLEVFERLLLVATTNPTGAIAPAETEKKKDCMPHIDAEANAVWDSALTKYDDLDSFFGKGREALKFLQAELIEQVAKDLVKDYGATEQDANQRAKKVVMMETGKRLGIWKKRQGND